MEMIERVARAIDPEAFKDWQSHYDYEMAKSGSATEAKEFADWSGGARIEDARKTAIAAIEAMFDPTEVAHTAPSSRREPWPVIKHRGL